jgi:crossover junction endodeoxyribonuclease RuvC
MSKIILGIDPGIADTGYGLIEKGAGGKISCLAYGSIKTKAGLPMAERLEILHDELEKIIQKYQPALASVEELFFQNNAKTAIIVGQARGVILLTCRKNKIPIVELTPLQVKQTIAGFGRADKLQVQKMVKLLLNLKEIPKPDDAADALAIAISSVNELKLVR